MNRKALAFCTSALLGLSIFAFGAAAPAMADDETTAPEVVTTEVVVPDVVIVPDEITVPEELTPPTEVTPPTDVTPPDESTTPDSTVLDQPTTVPDEQPVVESSLQRFSIAVAPEKVFVCKFVASDNSPGGFRLKDGKNPIEVSINALGDDVNNTGTFNDAQPSFVVAADDVLLCVHTEIVIQNEIVCPAGDVAGIVNVTTTTTTFYGTTQIGDPVVEHTTRALTIAELTACPGDPDDKKVWVCKFVASDNSPGGFRLKDGKNPIEVSINAIGDDVNDTGTFNDAQPSFVVASDDVTLCVHMVIVVDRQVTCPNPLEQTPGVATITTTTTTFYGTTQVGDPEVVVTYGDLTEQELANCPPTPVIPGQVTSNDPCGVDGTYTIPGTPGVLWSIDGQPVTPGLHQVDGVAAFTVVAAADAPDFVLEDGAQTAWPLVFTAQSCIQPASLASTGTSPGSGLGFAVGFLVLGAAALAIVRRRDTAGE